MVVFAFEPTDFHFGKLFGEDAAGAGEGKMLLGDVAVGPSDVCGVVVPKMNRWSHPSSPGSFAPAAGSYGDAGFTAGGFGEGVFDVIEDARFDHSGECSVGEHDGLCGGLDVLDSGSNTGGLGRGDGGGAEEIVSASDVGLVVPVSTGAGFEGSGGSVGDESVKGGALFDASTCTEEGGERAFGGVELVGVIVGGEAG